MVHSDSDDEREPAAKPGDPSYTPSKAEVERMIGDSGSDDEPERQRNAKVDLARSLSAEEGAIEEAVPPDRSDP